MCKPTVAGSHERASLRFAARRPPPLAAHPTSLAACALQPPTHRQARRPAVAASGPEGAGLGASQRQRRGEACHMAAAAASAAAGVACGGAVGACTSGMGVPRRLQARVEGVGWGPAAAYACSVANCNWRLLGHGAGPDGCWGRYTRCMPAEQGAKTGWTRPGRSRPHAQSLACPSLHCVAALAAQQSPRPRRHSLQLSVACACSPPLDCCGIPDHCTGASNSGQRARRQRRRHAMLRLELRAPGAPLACSHAAAVLPERPGKAGPRCSGAPPPVAPPCRRRQRRLRFTATHSRCCCLLLAAAALLGASAGPAAAEQPRTPLFVLLTPAEAPRA